METSPPPKCRYELPVVVSQGASDETSVWGCKLHGKCSRSFLDQQIKWCRECSQYIPAHGQYPKGVAPDAVRPRTAARAVAANGPISVNTERSSGRGLIPRGAYRNAGIRYPVAKEPVLPERTGTPLKWAYGITTVPDRRGNTFDRSLRSLAGAGFDQPHLFVDGDRDGQSWRDEYHCPVTNRSPRLGAYGNWILALGELFIRAPKSDRFAIFQDDLVCVRGLRAYLDGIQFPDKGYLNLYTFPQNQVMALGREGFYPSNQEGKGAVALVFDCTGVQKLLANNHMVQRVYDPVRGTKYIDGAVVETMRTTGWTEYVHSPSLVQHTGHVSTLQNPKHPVAPSFPGVEFDATVLLKGIGRYDHAAETTGAAPPTERE